MKNIVLSLLFIIPLTTSYAQDRLTNNWTVVAGLTQPILLKGVNVAGTYFTKKMSFEYSHGMFLHLKGSALKDKNVHSIYVPFSTGFGVGFRFTKRFDVRAEFKVHRFEAKLNAVQNVSYVNEDIGVGAYYRILPFGKRENWTKGIVIEPSIRYWQYFHSSLKDNKIVYTAESGAEEVHRPYNFGLFGNISIGYCFGSKK
jgi:hypothetical protein